MERPSSTRLEKILNRFSVGHTRNGSLHLNTERSRSGCEKKKKWKLRRDIGFVKKVNYYERYKGSQTWIYTCKSQAFLFGLALNESYSKGCRKGVTGSGRIEDSLGSYDWLLNWFFPLYKKSGPFVPKFHQDLLNTLILVKGSISGQYPNPSRICVEFQWI